MHHHSKSAFHRGPQHDAAAITTITRGYVARPAEVGLPAAASPIAELPVLVGQFAAPTIDSAAGSSGVAQCDAFPVSKEHFMVLVRLYLNKSLYYWFADLGDQSFQSAIRHWQQAGQAPVVLGNAAHARRAYLLPLLLGPGAQAALRLSGGPIARNPNFLQAIASFLAGGMDKRISSPQEFGIDAFQSVHSCIVTPEQPSKRNRTKQSQAVMPVNYH